MDLVQPDHEGVVERWLRDVVGPALDRHRARPFDARPIAEVMADLEGKMAAEKPRRSLPKRRAFAI